MDEENTNPEEETTEPDPVEPDWVLGEGTVHITNYKGGVLGHLKISAVHIDPKEGLVIEAENVEIFGDTAVSVVKIDSIDLTYEILQKILSLTEGAEIWVD